MILVNGARFVGVTIVSLYALELMSQYMLVTSITGFTVLVSMLGFDIEMLSVWTERKTIVYKDLKVVIITVALSLLVGNVAGVFWTGDIMLLLSITAASFIFNRYALILCYALSAQKSRLFANMIYQIINLVGIYYLVTSKEINYVFIFQILGYCTATLYVIVLHKSRIKRRDDDDNTVVDLKFISTHFIQITNNLIVRGDIYLFSRMLRGNVAGLLSSLVSYSDIGNILPSTFNNVLFVTDKNGEKSKQYAIRYFLILLTFFSVLYYFVAAQIFELQIAILLPLVIIKSSFFAGNILLTKYLVLPKKSLMIWLNALTIVVTSALYLYGFSLHVLLISIASGSLLRFALMYYRL